MDLHSTIIEQAHFTHFVHWITLAAFSLNIEHLYQMTSSMIRWAISLTIFQKMSSHHQFIHHLNNSEPRIGSEKYQFTEF